MGEGYKVRDIVRQVLASSITGTSIDISAAPKIAAELREMGFKARNATAEEFGKEIAEAESVRVRAIGQVESEAYDAAVKSNSVILDGEVLADGRRELMPYLLEQAVSITMHRFGIIRSVAGVERS